MGTSLLTTLALTGCGTPPAKDYGGSWKPVNRFQDTPSEIPLSVAYSFYASPMDGTLKTMLTRWASDSGMTLSYRLQSDFTLYKRASEIHTTDIQDAATELSSIYATQGVSVTAVGREIRVEQASAIVPVATTSKRASDDVKTAATPDTK
nr:hypothetical protein [Luteibacter rhizovicinus]